MVSEDFRKQVSGYGLTTAHILYRRPDHRWLLQSYIWQAYDLFPEFPELQRFLGARMNAKVTEVASSHVPMLSQPQRVYDVIVDAAANIGRRSSS